MERYYIFCQATLAKEGVNTDRRNTDKAPKNRVFPIRVYKIDNFLSILALLAPKSVDGMEKTVKQTNRVPILSLMAQTIRLRMGAFGLPVSALLRKYLLPLLGTTLIAWLLLRQIHLQTLGQMILKADGQWLLAGLGFYLLTNVFRCYRFGALWGATGFFTPLRLLPEMVALSFFNNVLPARGGELAFPYLLMQRRHDMPVGESVSILLILRIFDFLTVVTLYLLFVYLERGALEIAAELTIWAVAGLLTLALPLLVSLPWLGRHGVWAASWALRRLRLTDWQAGQWLLATGEKMVTTMAHVHALHIYLRVFFWSLLGWLSTYAWFAAFLVAVDLPTRYPLVIVGATFATLSKAIPFLTISGVGMHEAGWAWGFYLVGMDMQKAIASGFAVNLLTLFCALLLGGAAFAFMRVGHIRGSQDSGA